MIFIRDYGNFIQFVGMLEGYPDNRPRTIAPKKKYEMIFLAILQFSIKNSINSLFHQEFKISWQNSRKIHKIHKIFNEAFLVGTECKFDTQFQREINIKKIF